MQLGLRGPYVMVFVVLLFVSHILSVRPMLMLGERLGLPSPTWPPSGRKGTQIPVPSSTWSLVMVEIDAADSRPSGCRRQKNGHGPLPPNYSAPFHHLPAIGRPIRIWRGHTPAALAPPAAQGPTRQHFSP